MPTHLFLHDLALLALALHSMHSFAHFDRFARVLVHFLESQIHCLCMYETLPSQSMYAQSIQLNCWSFWLRFDFSRFFWILPLLLSPLRLSPCMTRTHIPNITLACIKHTPIDVQTHARERHQLFIVLLFHSFSSPPPLFSHFLLYVCHARNIFF
jgi:hypothetical protein